MALKATIYKADLQIADMDRHYYQDHTLTIAQHPSETDGRMMMRILAFILNADEQLGFTKGLSSDDEPDLWRKSLTGDIELWIDVGLPDERRIRKACNRADRVLIYSYGGRAADLWWEANRSKAERFDNLSVLHVPEESVTAMTKLVERSMRLQCSIQDGQLWIANQEASVQVDWQTWKTAD